MIYCRNCDAELPDGTAECPVCGHSEMYAVNGGVLPENNVLDEEQRKVIRRVIKNLFNIGAVCLLSFVLLRIVAYIPSCVYARDKGLYSSCIESLTTISKGVQGYLTENNDLSGIKGKKGEEFCNFILPGYDKKAECFEKNLVEKEIEQSCETYSVSLDFPNQFQYEIKGVARDKSQCKICVTEVGFCPQRYNPMKPGDSSCETNNGKPCECPH